MSIDSTREDDAAIFKKESNVRRPNRKDIRSINQVGPINVRRQLALKMITTFQALYCVIGRNFSHDSKSELHTHCRVTERESTHQKLKTSQLRIDDANTQV